MIRSILSLTVLVLTVLSLNVAIAAPTVPGKKFAAHGAYAKAKEECLAKDAGLKGKELRKCIKEKKAAK